MGTVLNSWKEIATYLNRGVRTAQRWEHSHHLPVHHVGSGKRAPVFAYASEIEAWRLKQRVTGVQACQAPALRDESRRLRGENQVLVVALRSRVAKIRRRWKRVETSTNLITMPASC